MRANTRTSAFYFHELHAFDARVGAAVNVSGIVSFASVQEMSMVL